MKKTKTTATATATAFKPMASNTLCIYCGKPLGTGPSANINARSGGPRVAKAHMECALSNVGTGMHPSGQTDKREIKPQQKPTPQFVLSEQRPDATPSASKSGKYDKNEDGTYQHPVFAEPFGPFSWCLHCEKASSTPAWAKADGCPYCDASPLDQWRWERIREFNPEYPETPVEGQLYPQYGKSA